MIDVMRIPWRVFGYLGRRIRARDDYQDGSQSPDQNAHRLPLG